jgi:hypothetical protein
MPIYTVGQPYLSSGKCPEGAEYNYRGGQHELYLLFRNPTPAEVAAVKSGAAEFALVLHRGVIFLLYSFSPGLPWSDAPYSIHLVRHDERTVPSEETLESRALLHVILVDAPRNTVLVLRALSLSPEFTTILHAAIRRQAVEPWDAAAHDAAIADAYRRWSSTAEMLGDAIVRCRGGA